MTIEDMDTYIESLWDWACLDGCFGNGHIKPTDIDGLVERNGKFLVIETKLPNAEIKKGQEILFQKMVETGLFNVVIVWGRPGMPETIILMTREATRKYTNANIGTLREISEIWYKWADND